MGVAAAVAVAVIFLWSGMVLAISFLEAPLKFRAPGVSLQVGLSIGRVVFRALNAVEVLLAMAVLVCLIVGPLATSATALSAVAIALLVVQLAAVRPRLGRRTNMVLAGQEAPRSLSHHAYIALEVLKVLTLLAAGITILALGS